MKRLEFLVLFSSTVLLRLAEGRSTPSTGSYQEKLPRAFASPLNVDSELDCAIKGLAWEYAKKLLPRVNQIHESKFMPLTLYLHSFFPNSMTKISWYTMHYS